MAGTLTRAGFPVVVWNRDRAKGRAVAAATGAEVGDTAAQVASAVDIVITSLADDAAVRDVYLGTAGVVEGIGPDQVAVETSTIDPGTVLEVGAAVDATGAGFLDCPV